jgi:uncharacterized protein (DUF433 family)
MDLPDFLYEDADHEIRIKGHRLRLIDVVARFDEGHSAEGIALDIYPTLELPLVYKTIAYFLEHEAQVRHLMDQNDSELARQGSLANSTPTLEQLRMRVLMMRPTQGI